ncbi:MAG: tetratricopeptide repeat protein [Verrucomicrobiota bacterium]
MKIPQLILALLIALALAPDASAKLAWRIAQQRAYQQQRAQQLARAKAKKEAEDRSAQAAAASATNAPQSAFSPTPNTAQPQATPVVRSTPNYSAFAPRRAPVMQPSAFAPQQLKQQTQPLQSGQKAQTTPGKPALPAAETGTSTNGSRMLIESHYNNPAEQALAFQRANAAKGNADSQYVMGMRYRFGIGVPKDRGLAREFLEKSAAQGNRKAIEQLKELY